MTADRPQLFAAAAAADGEGLTAVFPLPLCHIAAPTLPTTKAETYVKDKKKDGPSPIWPEDRGCPPGPNY